MAPLWTSIVFSLALCGIACWADARFRAEERLPMQWWVDGRVTWSAPRRIAVAFIPGLSTSMLVGLGVLLSYGRPRPGQEGLVIPSIIALGLIFLGAPLFHLWMVDRTIRRSGS